MQPTRLQLDSCTCSILFDGLMNDEYLVLYRNAPRGHAEPYITRHSEGPVTKAESPPPFSRTNQSKLVSKSKCKSPLLCSPGHFCPTPDKQILCPPGSFCPKASVKATTCNYQELLDQAPGTVIPANPTTVMTEVVDQGRPIGGNYCPPSSSTASSVQPLPAEQILLHPPIRGWTRQVHKSQNISSFICFSTLFIMIIASVLLSEGCGWLKSFAKCSHAKRATSVRTPASYGPVLKVTSARPTARCPSDVPGWQSAAQARGLLTSHWGGSWV